MVYLHHVNPLPEGFVFLGLPLWGIINEFHVGVTIFFVLSGFLIALRYMDKRINFKKYLWKRFVRIYPLYLIVTILTFIFNGWNSEFSRSLWAIFVLNVTFLRGLMESVKFSLVAQGWSLTVEEAFYILAPGIFLLIRKYGKIIYLAPAIFILIGILLSSIFEGTVVWGGIDFAMNYTFFGRSTEFFIGIYLAYLVKNSSSRGKFKILTPVTSAIGVLLATWFLHFLSIYFKNDFGIRSYLGMFINTLVIPIIAVAPVILSFTLNQGRYKILESRVLQNLGKSSYIFYLIHIGVVREILGIWGIPNEILMFIALLSISYLSWRFIEEPLHFKLAKFIGY